MLFHKYPEYSAIEQILKTKVIDLYSIPRLAVDSMIFVKEIQEEMIKTAFVQFADKTEAARALGVGRSTVYRKFKKYLQQ